MIPRKVNSKANAKAREVAKAQKQKDVLNLESRLKRKLKSLKNAKVYLKTIQSSPLTSEQMHEYFLSDLASENSIKRFKENESARRNKVSEDLKRGQVFDRASAWGVSFNASLKQLNVSFRQDLAKMIAKRYKGKQLRVASIGAGTGLAESQLQQKLGNKIELHATGLTALPSHWTKHPNYKNINWHITHAEKLCKVLGKNSMDVVFSNLGFHHAASNRFLGLSLKRSFKELEKILRPNGIAILNMEGTFNQYDVPRGLEIISNNIYTSQFRTVQNNTIKDYRHRVLVLRKKAS